MFCKDFGKIAFGRKNKLENVWRFRIYFLILHRQTLINPLKNKIMAAPFKRTRTKKVSEIAQEVIAEVKNLLRTQEGDIKEVSVEVHLVGHGARPFGQHFPNDYRDITIKVGKSKWDGLDDYDVRSLKYALDRYVSEFDGVERKDVFFGWGNFTPDIEGFPCAFRSFGKPCRAFTTLSKLVAKKYGITLKVSDLYSVRLFGKRGVYDESGERVYLAFRNSACQSLIDGIKAWGRKRTKASIVNNDNVEGLEYSIRYETECYGTRTRTIKVEKA